MFAQSLALCCLAAAVSTAMSAPANAELAVFLKTSPGQSSPTLEYMRTELADLMQGVGIRLKWQDPAAPVPPTGFPMLAVVQLTGVCAIPRDSFRATGIVGDGESLASTAVSGGHPLPFSSVDCGRLTNFVGPSLTGLPPACRDMLFGRALARVIAHELYHALVATVAHSRDGLSKEGFTAQDLLGASFHFDEPAAANLERRAEDAAVGAAPIGAGSTRQ
jgi:hypothetical protein